MNVARFVRSSSACWGRSVSLRPFNLMTIVRKINTKNESEDTEMERKVRYDRKLPIVLFIGQHFSGSLFESIYLSLHMYKALDAHA